MSTVESESTATVSVSAAAAREKAAVLRAKLLAKNAQRMAVVTGQAKANILHAPLDPLSTLTNTPPPLSTAAETTATSTRTLPANPSLPSSQSTETTLSDFSAVQPPISLPSSSSSSYSPLSASTASSQPAARPTSTEYIAAPVSVRWVSLMLAALAGVCNVWLPSFFSLSTFVLLSATLHCALPFLSSTQLSTSAAATNTEMSVDSLVHLLLSTLLPPSASRHLHWLSTLTSIVTCLQRITDDCCTWLFSSVLTHCVTHYITNQ